MWWLWWWSGSCFIGRISRMSSIFHHEVVKCPILGGEGNKHAIPRRTSSKLFMHFQHRWVFNRRRLLSMARMGPPLQAAWDGKSIDGASHHWGGASGEQEWCGRVVVLWLRAEGAAHDSLSKAKVHTSSCFWEWASSTVPQRTVWIWDLTFSNLIESDEKKPSSAYEPAPHPPRKEWLRRCSSMISSRRILNLKEQLYLCCYLMLRAKETGWFFFLMTRSVEMAVWTCFLGYVFSVATAALASKQFYRSCFSSTGDSGYYSQKLQHPKMTYETLQNPHDSGYPEYFWCIYCKCWHSLFFCNLKYKGLKKTINMGEHPGQKTNLCLAFRQKRKKCHNAEGRYNKDLANVAVRTFIFFLLTICLKRPNAYSFFLSKVVALARYLPSHFGSLLWNVAKGLALEERREMTGSRCWRERRKDGQKQQQK